MDDSEFKEVMNADTTSKTGALLLIRALAENEKMDDQQFEKVLSKLMEC